MIRLSLGDPERAQMEVRTRDGIPVPDALAARIRAIAESCGAEALI